MDKFKSGDVVKIVASAKQLGFICAPERLKGCSGTVLGENSDGFYRVNFSGIAGDFWCLREYHLEKVVG